MSFKFNGIRALLRLVKMLIYIAILLAIFALLDKRFRLQDAGLLIGVVLALLSPIFFLFLQYFLNDNRTLFLFEKASDKLLYRKRNKERIYLFSDITNIEIGVPPGRARKDSFAIYPQDDYFFYKFFLKNGDTITITSLLLNGKLLNPANFKDIPVKRKIYFFPFL